MHRIKIIGLLLFFASQFFFVAQAKNFILTAEGIGSDLVEAKASAIIALSQLIVSKVETSFSSDVAVHNDDVDRNMRTIKKIQSKQLLKGVVYFNEFKEVAGVRISAGLGQTGVNSTIKYMKTLLNVDYSLLNNEQKTELLTVTKQLMSFVSVFDQRVLKTYPDIKNWTQEKRVDLLKNLNQGRVIFVTGKVKTYIVEIGGELISSGDFLPEGNHAFRASAKGFRTVSGEFYISPSEVVSVKLPFIRAVENKSVRLILPNEFGFLREDIAEVLSDLGVNVSSDASNSIVIKVRKISEEIDEYYFHRLSVRIEVYKDKARVKKVTLKKKLIVEQGETGKVQKNIIRLARKGLLAVMSRVDLIDYFSQSK